MALLGQLHHIDIKVAFTLKTALRAPELFLCLLPILRDSRERQAKPNSPNSLTFVRLVPKSAPGEGYSETRSREPFFTLWSSIHKCSTCKYIFMLYLPNASVRIEEWCYTNYVICDQTDKDAFQCSQTSSRLKNRLNRASYLVSSPICGLKPRDRSMFYLTWKSTLQ